ncbi:hypothetical protein ACQPW3_35680 [Actinosynnema sp. CA-248983]
MMRKLSLPMFNEHGQDISLRDILTCIPRNGWTWSILDFYGVGDAPGGLAMSEFEELVRSMPTGYLLSWDELLTLAAGLHQVIDCTIVAGVQGDLVPEDLKINDFNRCAFVIQALDSTDWVLRAAEDVAMAARSLTEIKATYLNRQIW